MCKWKGLKQANGRVQVVKSSSGTDDVYDSDPSIVDSTRPFEAESKEVAQLKAEKELEYS